MNENYWELINKSSEFIKRVEKSISSAVGDDIKIDMKVNDLDTGNSIPKRIWDFINRNIGKNFPEDDYIAKPTKRGIWEFKPIFEKCTGTIYTLMREERLSQLRKELPRRRTLHYKQALAEGLNKDILPNQISFLEQQKYYNEDNLYKVLHKIFDDLDIPDNIVKHHAIILFRSINYELISLKCCLIKSDLNIIEECNWSNYIEVNESTVPELNLDSDPNYMNPTKGLKLKQKAKDKINQGELKDVKESREDIGNNR